MSHRIPTGYRDTGKNVAFADEVLEARGPGLVGQRAFDWNGLLAYYAVVASALVALLSRRRSHVRVPAMELRT
jgi:hypothetical protein